MANPIGSVKLGPILWLEEELEAMDSEDKDELDKRKRQLEEDLQESRKFRDWVDDKDESTGNEDFTFPCKSRRWSRTIASGGQVKLDKDDQHFCLVNSLDYNKECAVSWGNNSGLDGHSVWHLLSAMGLLMIPLSVMIIEKLMMKND